eukprot:165995-Hanusia_phi.AAC.1
MVRPARPGDSVPARSACQAVTVSLCATPVSASRPGPPTQSPGSLPCQVESPRQGQDVRARRRDKR